MNEIDQEIHVQMLKRIEADFKTGEELLQKEDAINREKNRRVEEEYQAKKQTLLDQMLGIIGLQYREYLEIDIICDYPYSNNFFLRNLPSSFEIRIWFKEISNTPLGYKLQYSIPDLYGEFSSLSLTYDQFCTALAMARRMYFQWESKAKELEYQNIDQPEPCLDVIEAIRKFVQDEIAKHMA